MSDTRKCRICGRLMRPRTLTHPSKADPSVCQVCADLMWALHGKRPSPKAVAA